MADAPQYTPHRPRPSFMDWLLVALNTAFVATGLFILPHEPNIGIVTIAFFGSCLALAARTVLRKLRYRRFTAERIAVAGGVPIRPSPTSLSLLGVWLGVLGVVLVVFGHAYPLEFRAVAAFVAVAGIGLAALTLTGRVPGGFLQFDPDALTIAHRGWRARIPWDDIASVEEGEYVSNPVLLVTLTERARLEIAPPGAHDLANREMDKTQAFMGADFAIMTRHYGIDLPVLAATVARYVQEPEARTELRPRLRHQN